MTPSPLLDVRGLTKHYPLKNSLFGGKGYVRAVNDVHFTIAPGEVVGLVGESGSGKTTLGRTLLRLIEPTAGTIFFQGTDITHLPQKALRGLRSAMQMIFQDPYASLNPRMTIGQSLGEALMLHGFATKKTLTDETVALLDRVGLAADHRHHYPHTFSGGQRQRVGIARALAVRPRFIVADEPVSALDVSIQAQIINLLQDLREELELSLLFIAHDLSVVKHISDKVMVMYLGRLMEIAPADALYANPIHPYTEALLSVIPIPDPTVKRRPILLKGSIPNPAHPPSGCVFRTRCPIATAACAETVPPLVEVQPGHFKACIHR